MRHAGKLIRHRLETSDNACAKRKLADFKHVVGLTATGVKWVSPQDPVVLLECLKSGREGKHY